MTSEKVTDQTHIPPPDWEALIEQIESLVPLVSVALDPGRGLVERLSAQSAASPLRVGGALDEPCAFEHLEVL